MDLAKVSHYFFLLLFYLLVQLEYVHSLHVPRHRLHQRDASDGGKHNGTVASNVRIQDPFPFSIAGVRYQASNYGNVHVPVERVLDMVFTVAAKEWDAVRALSFFFDVKMALPKRPLCL